VNIVVEMKIMGLPADPAEGRDSGPYQAVNVSLALGKVIFTPPSPDTCEQAVRDLIDDVHSRILDQVRVALRVPVVAAPGHTVRNAED